MKINLLGGAPLSPERAQRTARSVEAKDTDLCESLILWEEKQWQMEVQPTRPVLLEALVQLSQEHED